MAVVPSDLKTPIGKIDGASMFPGEVTATLDARLEAYIDEGEDEAGPLSEWDSQAELDAAVTQWAYYRAFEAVHIRLIANPAMVGIAGEGNTAFTSSQIESFGTLAAEFKARFAALIAVEANVAVQPIPSGGVPTSFGF